MKKEERMEQVASYNYSIESFRFTFTANAKRKIGFQALSTDVKML